MSISEMPPQMDELLLSIDRMDRIRGALEAHKEVWGGYLSQCSMPFNSLLVLRDWQGRFHFGVPGKKDFQSVESSERTKLREALETVKAAMGAQAYVPEFCFFSSELFDALALWDSTDKVLWDELHPVNVFWIERQGKEKIWSQTPQASVAEHPLRLVFFGIKGGVGRSSALSAAVYHLIRQGKKVLVLDADFESPGVSATLLAEDLRPDYGLVDWFALDALDPSRAPELVQQRQLLERSGLDGYTTGHGAAWIAPAFGRKTQDYVGKLGRLYQEVGEQSYVQRFQQVLLALEVELEPDVVLIDSRAGVDDTAALALTQLDAHGLLFATHGRSTWAGYAHLFAHWQYFACLTPGGEDFRSRLHVVSALTPVDSAYDRAFLDASYRLFLEHLYESLEADQMEGEGFNFSADEAHAPHRPWLVRWDDELRHFDPVQNPAQLNAAVFDKAFGELMALLDQLLEPREDAGS